MKDGHVGYLEAYVKKYKIFIDTCSLLSGGADQFWQKIVPILERTGKSVIVPECVFGELKKLAENPDYCRRKGSDDPYLNEKARRACKTVKELQERDLVHVHGDPNDGNFADNVFLSVFMRFRLRHNMMLITQDRKLTEAILDLGKDCGAVRGVREIRVKRLDGSGRLLDVLRPLPQESTPISVTRGRNTPAPAPETELDEEEVRFATATTVTDVPDTVIPVSSIPTAGDEVMIRRAGQSGTLRLGTPMGAGGEGIAYRTNKSGIIAKIYKRDKITRRKYEKLRLMLTREIDCDGVCFPMAMIYNAQGEFVGYLMKEAAGKELQKRFFVPKPVILKNFPQWTKVDTVQLCITILEKLKYLHDRNVILGDINPLNILFESPTKVYFVDTDSYQVEGFPCPVCTVPFTAPEIQKNNPVLRTIEHERFAVATLLFMIMLPGRQPYSMQGGEGVQENIIKGDFSYPLGDKKNGKVPPGSWRYCWSHLPYELKQAFYETFCRGEAHYGGRSRYTTGEWLQMFRRYPYLLTSGRMAEQDEESLLLFPTRFKRQLGRTYAKCKLCGREDDEERLKEGICPTCLRQGETYRCNTCGAEIRYTNYDKYVKHSKKHMSCRTCYEKRNMVAERRTCGVCGESFGITNGEKEFYAKKGFSLPRTCKNCRGGGHHAHTPTSSPTRVCVPQRESESRNASFLEIVLKSLFG